LQQERWIKTISSRVSKNPGISVMQQAIGWLCEKPSASEGGTKDSFLVAAARRAVSNIELSNDRPARKFPPESRVY
jgi:hypothetical protein